MAHFALLDSNNIVQLVLTLDNYNCADSNGNDSEEVGSNYLKMHHPDLIGTWKQTSYNKNFRKNFASIGYTYDAERDAFIPPKHLNSYVLNEDTCDWEPLIPIPSDASDTNRYSWDEDTLTWNKV